MTNEVILLAWQQFMDGKVVKTVKMDLTTTKEKLNEIKKEIALKENINIKDIFLIYSEKK